MEGLEIRDLTVANLPDLVSPCLLGGTLESRVSLPSESADEMTRSKLAYFHDRMRYGAAAKVAYRKSRVVGLLEYYPVELAPFPVLGQDLYVVNCLQVPETEGREEVEKELVSACVKDWSTRKGVVVLGRGKAWDGLGFEEVLRDTWPEGDERTLWFMKFWEVEEPRLAPLKADFPVFKGRVRVDVFESGHCPWGGYVRSLVESVVDEMGKEAFLERHDLDSREKVVEHGLSAGIALNGVFQSWLRPHPVPTREQIHEAIEDRL